MFYFRKDYTIGSENNLDFLQGKDYKGKRKMGKRVIFVNCATRQGEWRNFLV